MLGHFAAHLPAVRWVDDTRFKSPCPLPGHPDDDYSLLAREINGRIQVACFGGLGHTSEQILDALHLTADDLRIQNGAEKGPKSHAEPFSTDEIHRTAAGNGKALQRDFGRWQLEVGYQFKQWFSAIPEHQRAVLAANDEDALVETLVTQAKDWIGAEKRPFWPLPELNESELDEELCRLAVNAVKAFRDDYLPAIQGDRLPDTVSARELVICENADQAVVSNEEYLSRPAVVDRLLYTRAISLGVGGKHEGKTTDVRTEGLGCSAGESVLDGRPTMQTPVIYAASSDEYATTRMELLRMGWQRRGLPLTLIRVGDDEAEPREVLDRIAELAVKQGARLVILDMLFDFLRVQDENKYAQTRAAVGLIQTLADNIDGHVRATHHSPKWMPDAATAAKAALGSQGIAARFSPILLSKKWADDLFTIESTMTRDPRGAPIKPTVVVRDENGWSRTIGEFRPWMRWKMYAERILGLFEGAEDGRRMSVAQVMEALEISRVETQNALYQMTLNDGPLERKKEGRGYQYFLKNDDLFTRHDK